MGAFLSVQDDRWLPALWDPLHVAHGAALEFRGTDVPVTCRKNVSVSIYF